jgi:hypothetical protein
MPASSASTSFRFFKIKFSLPSLAHQCVITEHSSINCGEEKLDFFIVSEKNGGRSFHIAFNPLLSLPKPELLINRRLDEVIKEAAKDADEAPFFIIENCFGKIKGQVSATRTFNFGEHFMSELCIEENGSNRLSRVAFFPCHRQRKRVKIFTGKTIIVTPFSIQSRLSGKKSLALI